MRAPIHQRRACAASFTTDYPFPGLLVSYNTLECSIFGVCFLPALNSSKDYIQPSLAAFLSLVVELVHLHERLGASNKHCTQPGQSSNAYHHPQRRDVVRNRAEVNERRRCAIVPRHRADAVTASNARTDAIDRAGAAAAPARSRASSRRSTA